VVASWLQRGVDELGGLRRTCLDVSPSRRLSTVTDRYPEGLNGQHVFNEVVNSYLTRLKFASDDYASLIRLPAYEVAELIVEPSRGFGRPILAHGGAGLDDALALFRAGEPLEVVAEEYGVSRDQLEDAVRVATRIVA
jgi:uncharacterized protein (DUF433 family)